ncbi:MAG TPA: glycosyltransferase family 4 protein [Candidatus Binataceae bacterium]
MESPYRVGCLVSHPIQYQAPLFRFLAACPEIDLTVFYLSDLSTRRYRDAGFGIDVNWDVPLLDGYRSEFLPCVGDGARLSFWRPWTYRLRKRLAAAGIEALWIHGYAHQACLRAIAAARWLGIKVLLRGDSQPQCESRDPIVLNLKKRLLPPLFRAIDGFLTIGTLNRDYYRSYGVPAERLFPMPYAVDNAFFRARAEQARPRREQLRVELGLEPARPVILFASKLEHRKRGGDLLEAYARLSPDGRGEPAPYLLIVGDGEDRAALEARAGKLGWSSVRCVGFRNQTELPAIYDLCDVFVLPAEREPWGLVINEVMNAGKPVIVSDAVGAAPDLVAEGENGFVFPVGNIAALADRLRMLTSSPEHAAAMGAKSLERVGRFSFEADRKGLRIALDTIVARPAARAD